MPILRWQWTFANGGSVTALVDTDLGIETVKQGERTLAEAPRGSHPDGHTVLVEARQEPDGSDRPPLEALVTFDPKLPICVLRVDGHDVAPAVWPVRQRVPPPPEPARWPKPVLFAILGVTVLALAVLTVRKIASSIDGPALGPLVGTHRAANGLFIAHYPEELEPKPVILPSDVGGLLLVDKAKTVAIVITATPASGPANDPWSLYQRLRDETLANLPKGAAQFEEASRSDETCRGERGAVVTGYLSEKGNRRARTWSCAFEHGGAGYLTLFMMAESANPDAAARVRAIVDATELTRLADLGTVTEAPSK